MALATVKPRNPAAGSREKPQITSPALDVVDLASAGSWPELAVPAGWEPVAELCRRVHARAHAVVEEIVTRILEEIPAYRSDGTVPAADLRASVHSNLEMMLSGTAQRRGPLPAELAVRRTLGVRRADQGLPVNALLQAFLVGYRHLWDEILAEGRSETPAVRELLLTAAATVWEWVHDVTDAVGTAYHERLRSRMAMASAMRERLFEALLGASHDQDEIRSVATSLGLDPDGSFRGLAVTTTSTDHELAQTVTGQLAHRSSGTQHAIRRADELLLLDQGGDLVTIRGVIEDVAPAARLGVGLSRSGLQGAALSIGDAQRALAVAVRGQGTAEFEREWFAAVVVGSEHRLLDLLEPGISAARKSPAIARTVRAYADSGFSISATARSLHVHTNTVAYRLARWGDLTTWDPRSRDGLLRSLAAFSVAGLD